MDAFVEGQLATEVSLIVLDTLEIIVGVISPEQHWLKFCLSQT